MSNSKIGLQKLIPVFLSFVVMGLADIIGVATGLCQAGFCPDFIAQFLPVMVLLWFF